MCFKHWGYASEGFKFCDFKFLFSFGAPILKCGDQKRVDLIFQKSGRPDFRAEKKVPDLMNSIWEFNGRNTPR